MTAGAVTRGDLPATAAVARGSWESQRRRVTAILFAAPLAVMALLFVLPLLVLIWLSFFGDDGFSIRAYAELTRPVYGRLMLFTLELAFVVTVICVAISYPIAYLLANVQGPYARWMTLALLLALWLSVLARTYSWIIILQRNGIVNTMLTWSGLTQSPLSLVYNRTGVYIGMVHILLPFMVMTLVPMLRAIDPQLLRSALSLGANPWKTFWRVYFPLSLPGVVAGSILVFTMALGFFITPAILGGGRASTIVMAIKDQVQVLVDLQLAAATSVMLLIVSIGILLIYEKVAGVDRIFGTGRQ
jgi:putative spermidine/putrescine transport system permease protein/spermidine/putrescine transport system permease protein